MRLWRKETTNPPGNYYAQWFVKSTNPEEAEVKARRNHGLSWNPAVERSLPWGLPDWTQEEHLIWLMLVLVRRNLKQDPPVSTESSTQQEIPITLLVIGPSLSTVWIRGSCFWLWCFYFHHLSFLGSLGDLIHSFCFGYLLYAKSLLISISRLNLFSNSRLLPAQHLHSDV